MLCASTYLLQRLNNNCGIFSLKYVHEQKETNVLNIKEEVVCGSGCGSVG